MSSSNISQRGVTVTRTFPVVDYALGETLSSGQAFRWRAVAGGWESILGGRWVRLFSGPDAITAEAIRLGETEEDWRWIEEYLQLNVNLAEVLATFPQDAHLQRAVRTCRGLRLLRQDPWECLASFILSSTKRIVQIQQVVDLLCDRFGSEVPAPAGSVSRAFPSAETIAALSDGDLRCCKMGFRAPYLKATAEMVAGGAIDLRSLFGMDLERARRELLRLPGVGRKIADCVLLFAYGFQRAFPVDVWVLKALRQLYFPRRKPDPKRLIRFTETYFGPHAGYAQQYLFHFMRTHTGDVKND